MTALTAAAIRASCERSTPELDPRMLVGGVPTGGRTLAPAESHLAADEQATPPTNTLKAA